MTVFVERALHLISFNVPFPADYGGVIDVYYKLKAFHDLGVRVHLHCFNYGRGPQKALSGLCESVRYYPRKGPLTSFAGPRPYIVASRRSAALLENLKSDDAPIIFEGIHSCYYLNHPALKKRLRAVRVYNVESRYYANLGRLHRNPFQKAFYAIEASRLARFEPLVSGAGAIFAITPEEAGYFTRFNPSTVCVPPFHGNASVARHAAPRGDYLLFHGDLSIEDNRRAAEILAREVFQGLPLPFVIAGRRPPAGLAEAVRRISSGKLVADPDEEEMNRLIAGAHAVVLWSPAQSGFRLKLLNSLFKGRHCVANPGVVAGTGLESLCEVADTPAGLRAKILSLLPKPYTDAERERRLAILSDRFSDRLNVERILEKIFG